MPTDAKTLYRRGTKKFHFHWNRLLDMLRLALGRRAFPTSRKKGRPTLGTVGVIALRGQDSHDGIALPAGFQATVDAFAAEAGRRFALSRNCILRSADAAITQRLATGNLPERTADVPEVRRGEVATIRLRQTLDMPGLETIAQALIPQIEDRIYHAPVVVETATVYRHAPSVLPEYSSILWHSDNHFEGVIKIMVYLTDVTAQTAPFEYLRHKETHRPTRVAPRWPQRYPYGRVPQEVVDGYLREGYAAFQVTGPRGTVLIFDDKIIHKGNYAEQGYRDVLVMQLQPTAAVGGPYIDPRRTTSV